MKNIKKIICLCIALSLLITSAFAYGTNTLSYLGVTGEGINDLSPATREILAYTLAEVMLPDNEFTPVDTAFADVKADNKYSGYIKLMSDRGIMNGTGDGLFNPGGFAGINEVSKTFVSLLGYDAVAQARGGWPGGYLAVASALKLFKGVDTSKANFTYADLKIMLLNLLECPIPQESIYTENGQFGTSISTKDKGITYANEALDLYEYEAVVTDIDYKSYKATVTFSQQYSDNSKYKYGDVKVFDVDENLNIAYYENLPAKLVIYDDRLIVDAVLEEGIITSYGVVDSVNNETTVTSYNVNYINAITLADDKNDYTFEDDCIFMFNGAEVTNGTLSLMDKYVRIVQRDEKIILLSLYNLKDGGRIASVERDNIDYFVGTSPMRLGKVMDADELIVVIDGELRGYKELKAGMLFSYWRSNDATTLVIAASGKQYSDVLHGISTSDKTLSLGNISVSYADDVYSSPDGANYLSGTDVLMELTGTDVVAAVDIYDKVRYVESYSPTASADKFYGYILGYKEGTSLSSAEVRMACVSEEGVPVRDFVVNKNAKLNDSTDISSVTESAGTTDGSALFEVLFNSKGEVTRFKSLVHLEGTGGATGNFYTFPSGSPPSLAINRMYIKIPETTPVVIARNDGQEIKVTKITYSSVKGKTIPGEGSNTVNLSFFADAKGEEITLIHMTGSVELLPSKSGNGIVERVGMSLNNEGDAVPSLTIDGITYPLANGNTITPAKGNFVTFTESFMNPGEITINNTLDVNKDFSEWHGMEYGDRKRFCFGSVTKRSSKKISFIAQEEYVIHKDEKDETKSKIITKGEEIHFYYESDCKFYGIDSNGEISTLSFRDIEPGMETALLLVRAKDYYACSVGAVYIRVD